MQIGNRNVRTIGFDPGICCHLGPDFFVHCTGRVLLSNFVRHRAAEYFSGGLTNTVMDMDNDADVELS